MSSIDVAHELGPVPGWVLAALHERRPRAIRHPLGFICLPLVRDDVNVCVHVWTTRLRQARPTTSLVHCHSWDLTSHVLYGRLRNELVHVVDDDSEPTHRVFEIHCHGDRDDITPTGRLVRWRRAATACYSAGETYEVPAGSFHTTVVPKGHEAATVLLARVRPGRVDLSLGGPDLAGHTVARERCDADETALAISTVFRRLGSDDDTRSAMP
jgi:hypothetical protein